MLDFFHFHNFRSGKSTFSPVNIWLDNQNHLHLNIGSKKYESKLKRERLGYVWRSSKDGSNMFACVAFPGKFVLVKYSTVPLPTDSTTLRIIWKPVTVTFKLLHDHTNERYHKSNGLYRRQKEKGECDIIKISVWLENENRWATGKGEIIRNEISGISYISTKKTTDLPEDYLCCWSSGMVLC